MRDGQLDLLVGDAYGDVLVLVGNGDGTFAPTTRPTRPSPWPWPTSPATASPTSSTPTRGSIASWSTTAATRPTVLGDRSSGLLAPGAVKLADLNGDGIPDLIVANSGSNNVLVYPGLGDGQFGPALNGGHGFFTGTNPTGLHRRRPQRRRPRPAGGQHRLQRRLGPARPGERLELDADPRAADQDRRRAGRRWPWATSSTTASPTWPWPTARPTTCRSSRASAAASSTTSRRRCGPTRSARPPAGCSWATSTGSGTGPGDAQRRLEHGTLITGPASASPVTQTFATGGLRPTTGFAGDFTGNGFTDLVVGNNGDGHLALLLGGRAG